MTSCAGHSIHDRLVLILFGALVRSFLNDEMEVERLALTCESPLAMIRSIAELEDPAELVMCRSRSDLAASARHVAIRVNMQLLD